MKKVQLSGGGLTSTALTVIKIKELDHIFVADYDQSELTDEWDAVNRTITALSMPYPIVTASQLNLKHNNWLSKANTGSSISRGSLLMFVACCACEAIHKYGTEHPIQIMLGLTTEDLPDIEKFKKEYNEVLAVTFGQSSTSEPLIQVDFPYADFSTENLVALALSRINSYAQEGVMGANPRIIWEYSMYSEKRNELYIKMK